MASNRTIRADYQYLLSLIPLWMSGDEEPTAIDVVAVGGWEQVEAIRKRVEEIRANLSTIPNTH